MKTKSADTDRRRVRRPLSPQEIEKLIEAAHRGPVIDEVSGPERAIAYIIAAYTGFRRNEIGSVTLRSFNFDSTPATLTVTAGHSKRRRTDVIPLRSDLADQIRQWIASQPAINPNEPLLKISDKRTALMLKSDLKRAGIAQIDEQGRVADFHGLRATFITNRSKAGVSPKTAQTLARRPDINLTMNTYTLLGVHDQASAIESLPPVPRSDSGTKRVVEVAQATGTDGANGVNRGALYGALEAAFQGGSGCIWMHKPGGAFERKKGGGNAKNPGKSRRKYGEGGIRTPERGNTPLPV